MNTEIQKLKKLCEILKERFSNTKKASVFLSHFELKNIPLLNDRLGLKKTLRLAEDQSGGKITWEETVKSLPIGGTAASYNGPTFAPPESIGFEIHIEEPEKIEAYFKSITEHKSAKTIPGQNRLIEKNENGEYLLKGIKIEIPKTTIYFEIFDIIFLDSDQDGFISYDDIEKELRKRGQPALEGKERKVRIYNAITNEYQGFFRGAKINGKRIENKTPRGQKIITVIRGKGLKINNPVL